MKRFFQFFIKVYAVCISPLTEPSCRYYPTCSAYMYEAIEKHGSFKGVCLGMIRILSCHAWSKRPFHDSVPERFAWRDFFRYKR
ncbi:MAG: membrane protein insertion efficiency factor YidD [Alphaproteobacteria bacterium]|nr:membrane protein insertion efficiency factor YidD [Alphaproteobacteria bacterium]